MPPEEAVDDEEPKGISAEETVTTTDEVKQEPVHEGQTAGSLRIEANLLFLFLALKLFWS